MRSFVKRVIARLPWKLRKLVMFFVEHGLTSPPPFSGVYTTFDEVSGSMSVAEGDQAAAAARGIAGGPRFDEATKLPRLQRAHSLSPLAVAMLASGRLAAPFRILDFGGAAGVDYANLLSAVHLNIDVRYYVVDLPAVCAVGRARWQHDARVSSAAFDLVYSWSSIHYGPIHYGCWDNSQFISLPRFYLPVLHSPPVEPSFALRSINPRHFLNGS